MQILKRFSSLVIKRYNAVPIGYRYKKKNFLFGKNCSYSSLKTCKSSVLNRYYHEEIYYSDSEERSYISEDFIPDPLISVRNILYTNSSDHLIILLNNSASVQDVFDFIKQYEKKMDHTHIAQTVLVLWDIQKMFYNFNIFYNATDVSYVAQDYIDRLLASKEFKVLLKLIENNVENFSMEALSCIFIYLNKIGLDLNHKTSELLNYQLRKQFKEEDFSLTAVSRYVVTVFNNINLSSYYLVQDMVPQIFSFMDKCETAEDIKLLTICLNNINQLVTEELLLKYQSIIKRSIQNKILNRYEYRPLIKVILFLNYPHWRDKNTTLISECMMLLKNNIHVLNLHELLIFYEIFYKTQEPAELLNEIQRYANKFLHELEDEESKQLDIRLKLLSCIVCFSSPANRPQFERVIRKYLEYNLNGRALLELHKIILFLKKSDIKLCDIFWDKVLNLMEENSTFRNEQLLKMCYNYMNFNQDLDNYRHLKFEKRMNKWLKDKIEYDIIDLIPSRFSTLASFILAYGDTQDIINLVVNKLNGNWEQLNHVDCVNISKSIHISKFWSNNTFVHDTHVRTLNTILDNCLAKEIHNNMDINKTNLLLKSCIYRNKFDSDHIKKLLETYNDAECLSSKMIKNITFCLHSTNTLLPSIIDKMANYVYQYKNHVLGFNVEKIAYLCYYLGYTPKVSNDFFKTVSDIILRDQERLSGLSYLQTCLSLSFFNQLPESFIKQIFNIEFLEKLDMELLHCYSKDVYPIRVRHSMMQLNRSVCMDYPESNVPWFHKQYVENSTRKAIEENTGYLFHYKVNEYLMKCFKHPEHILENVVSPYGYHIDFVIHFNEEFEITDPSKDENSKKVAVLLMRPKSYTKQNIQLKGTIQLKKRHLEMLGYTVLVVNFNDWRSFICGEDKIDYIKKLFNNSVYDKNVEINQ